MVDVGGTAKGTTSTVDLREEDESASAPLPFFAEVAGVITRIAWVVLPPTSSSLRPRFSAWDKEEGMGIECEANKTEYWRSHMWMMSSREGCFVIPARSTNDEPRVRIEISWVCFSESAVREVRVMVSAEVRIVVVSAEGWRRKECHAPERAGHRQVC